MPRSSSGDWYRRDSISGLHGSKPMWCLGIPGMNKSSIRRFVRRIYPSGACTTVQRMRRLSDRPLQCVARVQHAGQHHAGCGVDSRLPVTSLARNPDASASSEGMRSKERFSIGRPAREMHSRIGTRERPSRRAKYSSSLVSSVAVGRRSRRRLFPISRSSRQAFQLFSLR